jgi:hypothetical protein
MSDVQHPYPKRLFFYPQSEDGVPMPEYTQLTSKEKDQLACLLCPYQFG